MKTSHLALAVGLALGVVAAFATFAQFVVVVAFGAIGLLIGLVIEGRIDVRSLLARRR